MQLVYNGHHKDAGQHGDQKVRHRHGKDEPVEAEKAFQDEKGWDIDQPLPRDGYDESRQGLSHRLEAVHQDHSHSGEGNGEHIGSQHFAAESKDFLILDECSNQRTRENHKHQGENHAEPQVDQHGGKQGFFEPGIVAGSIVEADERLHSDGNADEHKDGDGKHPRSHAQCGNRAHAINGGQVVGYGVSHAHHDLADGSGNSDEQNFAVDAPAGMEKLPGWRCHGVFAVVVVNVVCHAQALTNHGGDGGSGYTHVQAKDEDRVKNYVCAGADKKSIHGFSRGSFGAHKLNQSEFQNDKGAAQQKPIHILAGGKHGFRGGSHSLQKQRDGQNPRHTQNDRYDQRTEYGGAGGFAGLVIFLPAQEPGKIAGAANPENS